MKMKRFVILLAAMALLLAACGAKSANSYGSASTEMSYAESPAYYPEAEAGAGDTASGGLSDQRMLIKTAYLSVETEDMEEALRQIAERIAAFGGYVESQEQYNGGSSSYRSRSASMVIRVPADKLDSFVDQVQGVSNVLSYRQSQEDVTLTYVATESRIRTLQAEEDRLVELMAQAKDMADLLKIEQRLTQVRSDLESTTSQLRVMSNQVEYATVELDVRQVAVLTPVEKQTVWQRIGSGFGENLADIAEDLGDFFVWFVVYLPQILIFAVVVFVIVRLCRRSAKKSREKRLAQQQALWNAQHNKNQNPPQA